MLTKAKRFFQNPVYLLAVIVSLAVVGVGAAFAISVFADGAPEGWEQDDDYAITYYNPMVLYLDEGDYGDSVDVTFDVKRVKEETTTSYRQVNGYQLKSDLTYYVKASLDGTTAVYEWYDENGEKQNVPHPTYNNKTISNLQPYLLSGYTYTSVYNELAEQIGNKKIWLYCTKKQHVQIDNAVYEDRDISFCCGSITIAQYFENLGRYSQSNTQLKADSQPVQTVGNVKNFTGIEKYTFDQAVGNWGAEQTNGFWNIENYGFDESEATSYRVVLGRGDTPPAKGAVDAISVGTWYGYTMPAIYAFYAPDHWYQAKLSGTRRTNAEPSEVTGSSEDRKEVEYDDYKSFRLNKSEAGGFYFTAEKNSAYIPYAWDTSNSQNGYWSNKNHTSPK